MKPMIKIIPNTPITDEWRVYSILKGTYYYLIPDHKKPIWQDLVLKYERSETLTESEIEFLQEMNSYTCKVNDRITRREAAKINAKYRIKAYIVGFEQPWL